MKDLFTVGMRLQTCAEELRAIQRRDIRDLTDIDNIMRDMANELMEFAIEFQEASLTE